jgi:hypothetical protein
MYDDDLDVIMGELVGADPFPGNSQAETLLKQDRPFTAGEKKVIDDFLAASQRAFTPEELKLVDRYQGRVSEELQKIAETGTFVDPFTGKKTKLGPFSYDSDWELKNKKPTPPASKTPWWAWALIGVAGVGIVGGTIYAVTRKK